MLAMNADLPDPDSPYTRIGLFGESNVPKSSFFQREWDELINK